MSGNQWTTQDYVYVTAECVTGVLSVLGNGLVLLAIAKTRALRTVTNCFIGSLAVADMLVGCVVPPTVVLSYLGLPMHFYGCVLLNTLVVLITNISILNLLAVALERFLAISDPFRYQRVMTVRRALAVVAVTWVVAILLGLIPTMGWNLGDSNFQSCSFTSVIDMKYMVYLIFFGVNLPPLVFMLLIYVYIFHIIRKQQRMMAAQLTVLSREERRHARQRRREVRGAKGLAYVIILFAVCWMPIHIMNSLTLFAPEKAAPLQWLLVAIVLSHANSFINPFLYAFGYSQFKRAMKRLLCCGHLHSVYGSDSSDGTLKHRPSNTSPALGYGRSKAASPSLSVGRAGRVGVETITDSVSSEDSDRRGKHVSRAGRLTVGNGVVNAAYDVDTSDEEEEGRTVSPGTALHDTKALRWSEQVDTIPACTDVPSAPGLISDGGADVDSVDSVAQDGLVIIIPNVNASSSTDTRHGVWVTSSSQSIHHSPSSTSNQRHSPPMSPYPDRPGGLCHNSTVETLVFRDERTGVSPESDYGQKHILRPQTENLTCDVNNKFSLSEREDTCLADSTQTQTQRQTNLLEGDRSRKEDGDGELSVLFVYPTDDSDTGYDFGSKRFVSVRL